MSRDIQSFSLFTLAASNREVGKRKDFRQWGSGSGREGGREEGGTTPKTLLVLVISCYAIVSVATRQQCSLSLDKKKKKRAHGEGTGGNYNTSDDILW